MHSVHSSEERHWRGRERWLDSSIPEWHRKYLGFYCLVMVNKKQWILGADALLFLQSVRQFTAGQGL